MNYEVIGMMNQHLLLSRDSGNVSSTNNGSMFGEILEGNADSPQFDYLLNMGANRLSDTKSIRMFNESNLAAQINAMRKYEEITDEKTIYLDKKPVKVKTKLVEALANRHSTRRYTNISIMSLNELSTILLFSFGVAKRKENYFGIDVTTRYHGSGGGLYPIDIYLVINRVDGLDKGIYKYQPISHTLRYISKEFEMKKLFPYGSFDLENFSFCVLYEYDINRNYVKYGELALMVTLVEVGLMAQNLDLISAAMDYTTCQAAGFEKKYADKKLCLDGVNSHIIYTHLCGKE